MPENGPVGFRIVSSDSRPPRRRRGPGPAVVLVGIYAIVFIASLFVLKDRAARSAEKAPAHGASPRKVPDRPAPSRAALLEAAVLSTAARAEYFRRLSTDCCPCGCDLNLRDCLVSDQSCQKSPELAAVLFRELE